jgi:hypothetical protein
MFDIKNYFLRRLKIAAMGALCVTLGVTASVICPILDRTGHIGLALLFCFVDLTAVIVLMSYLTDMLDN